MNRKQYLDELSFLLSDISDEERLDALSFYENYFDEAGIENEQKIILELGEPSQVAAVIKDSIKGHFEENISSSDRGFENSFYQRNYEVVQNKTKESLFESLKRKFSDLSSRDRLLLIAILIVFIFPVTGIIFGTLEIGLSVLIVPLALFFSAWVITLMLFIIGICLIVGGVLSFFNIPGLGFLMLGGGIIIVAIADVCFKVSKWMIKDVVPKIIDMISSLFHRLFGIGVSAQ